MAPRIQEIADQLIDGFIDQGQADLLRRQPELIEGAIEELLRYEGPVEMATMRYAAEDVTVGDIHIRWGTPVVVILGGANRDPRSFSEPAALEVSRDAKQHIGFGYGVHYCVGAPLARLEARIAFETILSRLPNIRLTVPDASLKYTESAVVHGVKSLPITWDISKKS